MSRVDAVHMHANVLAYRESATLMTAKS